MKNKQCEFLTPPQVARMLGTDAGRVLVWIRNGSLKAFNLSEGDRPRWKIHPDDVRTFLDSKSNQNESNQ
jgi:predicted site-specific integrase-resolvase